MSIVTENKNNFLKRNTYVYINIIHTHTHTQSQGFSPNGNRFSYVSRVGSKSSSHKGVLTPVPCTGRQHGFSVHTFNFVTLKDRPDMDLRSGLCKKGSQLSIRKLKASILIDEMLVSVSCAFTRLGFESWLGQPFTGYLTLGKLLIISESPCPHL